MTAFYNLFFNLLLFCSSAQLRWDRGSKIFFLASYLETCILNFLPHPPTVPKKVEQLRQQAFLIIESGKLSCSIFAQLVSTWPKLSKTGLYVINP
jgi:hypothetical protein